MKIDFPAAPQVCLTPRISLITAKIKVISL
jgi:hypothetical protein